MAPGWQKSEFHSEFVITFNLQVTVSSAGASESRLLYEQEGMQLPDWRGNTKHLDAQAAVLWAQVMTAVQVSGYNIVAPPGARGASKDWVRDGVRMQRSAPYPVVMQSATHGDKWGGMS